MTIKGSAVFDYKDLEFDGKTQTDIYSVRYEIYDTDLGAGMLPTGKLEIKEEMDSSSGNRRTWKLILFDGTIYQGESRGAEQAQSKAIDVLSDYFLDERNYFRLIKIDEHRYMVKSSHRNTILTFKNDKVKYEFLDLDFSKEIDAGDLEGEIINYLKKQEEAGTDYPVDDNICWVFWFSRHFNDDRRLELVKAMNSLP